MPNALSQFIRRLAAFQLWVATVAALLMVLHVVIDFTMRYLLNYTPAGTMEIASNYYLVAMTFLPLATVELRNEHVQVEAFTHFLPGRYLRIIDVAVLAICIVMMTLYAWRTGVAAWEHTERGEFLQTGRLSLPIWPTRWLLPFGLAAMELCMIQRLARLALPGTDGGEAVRGAGA